MGKAEGGRDERREGGRDGGREVGVAVEVVRGAHGGAGVRSYVLLTGPLGSPLQLRTPLTLLLISKELS